MNKRRYLALLLVAVFTIGTILVPERTTYAAKKTQLNKKSVTIQIGKTVTLKLKNAPKGKKIKWTSSKKKVAVVNGKGRVQGKSAGKAKITAKVGKKKYTCTVTVKKKEKPQQVTAEAPTTQTVTEAPATTEIPTTEAPTTEAPTTEKEKIFPAQDLSKYGDIEKVTINGVTYNVASKLKAEITDDQIYNQVSVHYDNNDYLSTLSIGIGNNSILKNCDPNRLMLYFLGKFSVRDGNEKEYFDRMIFFCEEVERPESLPVIQKKVEKELCIHMYNPLENGKLYEVSFHRIYYGEYSYLTTELLNYYQNTHAVMTCNDENEIAIVPTPKNLNWDDLLKNETKLNQILKK